MVEYKASDTWVGRAPVAVSDGHLEACLVHIYPSGPDLGRRYPLAAGRTVIGRGESAGVRVQDNSVSRTHAVVESNADGCYIIDQKSLNGTHVNDRPVGGAHQLADGDYVRVGNAIYRYLEGGNIEAEYHEEIYRMAIVDGLTHLHNRRYLTDFLERELARARRHGRPLSVLLFDLDHFKRVNDTHGHLGGDHVLRDLSERLKPTIRREDLLARYGGEEFCLVLVETEHPQAVATGERIRRLVGSAPFVFEGEPVAVTVSVGAATADDTHHTPDDLLGAADAKLYEAKRGGRNAVVG
jgi:two-component system cell cycle response regulator